MVSGEEAKVEPLLPNSAQVLVLSWVSVLAVTTPRVSGAVQKAQRQSWAMVADLAMPWPEAIAFDCLVEVEDADLDSVH